jgi:hypothetical protein
MDGWMDGQKKELYSKRHRASYHNHYFKKHQLDALFIILKNCIVL